MGKPAARVGDMHVCPMVTPGVPPIPHVGGPIMPPGVPTVLIGGMPAATLGNMCTCTGPPDSIILGSTGVMIGGQPAARMGDSTAHGGSIVVGCPTVLIGEAGGGGGGASGGGGGSGSSSSGGGNVPPQTATLKEAAKDGTPFCEECAKAAGK
ncbi:MAG: PAAR domain-containing protein [Bacteroidales bacterium]|nr:PAAR domain-containing protein [Bacteroidales bacterium]